MPYQASRLDNTEPSDTRGKSKVKTCFFLAPEFLIYNSSPINGYDRYS
jgi:hypothetical protein